MKIDATKIKELMKKKGMNQSELARSVGVDQSTISNYLAGRSEPQTFIVNSICFVLGCEVKDIEQKEVVAEKSASTIIADSKTAEELSKLKTEIDSIKSDIIELANLCLEINKTCKEAKAQTELNAEELTAIFNKVTDCSSGINKAIGGMKKRNF